MCFCDARCQQKARRVLFTGPRLLFSPLYPSFMERLAVQASPFVVELRESPFDAEISNNFESTKLMMLADFVYFGSC
jgi:hypothetical protein